MKNIKLNLQKKNIRAKDFFINYALYMLIGLVIITYALMSPVFISPSNIRELLALASPLLVSAIGITFVLLISEIDLSIGSIAGVSGALWVVSSVTWGLSFGLATIIAISGGMVMGLANALLISKLKINSFLVTLGMQMLGRGLVFFISSGEQVLVTSQMKSVVKADVVGNIPVIILISLGLTIVMSLVYKYTSFGRKVQAVGCNKAAAKKVGINVTKITFQVFVLSGLFAGIAGMLQVGKLGILSPSSVGNNLEFLAITACVLGGTSLFGGRGSILPGVLIGVLFTMSIENGLGILGANPYIYPVVRGAIIFLAMFTDSLKRSVGINICK